MTEQFNVYNSAPSLRVLHYIYGGYSSTENLIGATSIHKTTLSQILLYLEEEKLIKVKTDDKDSRRKIYLKGFFKPAFISWAKQKIREKIKLYPTYPPITNKEIEEITQKFLDDEIGKRIFEEAVENLIFGEDKAAFHIRSIGRVFQIVCIVVSRLHFGLQRNKISLSKEVRDFITLIDDYFVPFYSYVDEYAYNLQKEIEENKESGRK